MISEFYQYGVDEKTLKKMEEQAGTRILKEKLRDMQVVFAGFQEFIEKKYITAEEVLDVLSRMIPPVGDFKGQRGDAGRFRGFHAGPVPGAGAARCSAAARWW